MFQNKVQLEIKIHQGCDCLFYLKLNIEHGQRMRNGVGSKRRFVLGILQFAFGLVIGHLCCIIHRRSYTTSGNISESNECCFKAPYFVNNSLHSSYDNQSAAEQQFLNDDVEKDRNDGLVENGIHDEKHGRYEEETILSKMARSRDATLSGNFTNLMSDEDLLLVGVLTSNQFLRSRACTVFNTWAKHIQVKLGKTRLDKYNNQI